MTAKELKAKLDAAKVKYKKSATIPELEALLKAYEGDKAARDAAQGTTPPSAHDASASDAPSDAPASAPSGDGMELPPGAEIVSNPTATKEGKIDVYGIKDDGKYGVVSPQRADNPLVSNSR